MCQENNFYYVLADEILTYVGEEALKCFSKWHYAVTIIWTIFCSIFFLIFSTMFWTEIFSCLYDFSLFMKYSDKYPPGCFSITILRLVDTFSNVLWCSIVKNWYFLMIYSSTFVVGYYIGLTLSFLLNKTEQVLMIHSYEGSQWIYLVDGTNTTKMGILQANIERNWNWFLTDFHSLQFSSTIERSEQR